MSDDQQGMGKRSLMLALAIGGAVLILVLIASLAAGMWKSDPSPIQGKTRPAGPEVLTYFGDIKDGSKLERWTVVAVSDVRDGGIPVEMATPDGKHFFIELLRRDPSGPKGVAETPTLAIYLVNSPGDGGVATPEEQGQGIMALAAALSTRENNGGAKPPALSTLKERMAMPPAPASGRDAVDSGT